MRVEKPVADQSVGSPAQDRSYKGTLNLPKTEFPMRAGLASLEPALLEAWTDEDLYGQLREQSFGRELFTLHDGPPYANGHLHMGHALNKVLKDMVVRSRQMSGQDARFVPGWDCHGLPVEWKVEEEYRARGLDKDKVPTLEFRQSCRDYAARWVGVQRAEFKRLGVNADWHHPYLTMDFANEAAVAREFMTFLMNRTLYQSSKPVMWSPVEKTALAEAEVEYHDRTTTSAWVAYEVMSEHPLRGALLPAWTTTPWTLPASQCVCYSPSLPYALYEVSSSDGALEAGARLVLACEAVERTAESLQAKLSHVRDLEDKELLMLELEHPLARLDAQWGACLRAVPGEHVRADSGTGLVHTAPDHGDDDYKAGLPYGLPMLHTLTDDGRLREDMPVFGGLAVVTADGRDGPANARVLEALARVGRLLGSSKLTHSYPHSWRSKAPVLYRATPQWFVALDKPVRDGMDLGGETLRERALSSLDGVSWLPHTSKNRLRSMLEGRPDWVLSRQRTWGVPLTLFMRRDRDPHHDDFLLRDERVNARVVEVFQAEGADAWYQDGAKERFLAPHHDPELYEMCFDVLDVWFESGSSHAFVLKDRPDGPESGVADLYLEGTDQHRGWFQASLLQSVGTTGRAPFKAVLTHGFALDGKGRKMSKSVGNVVAPEDVVKRHGADVLRMWVAQADYTRDFRAGEDALKGASETFRKVRNTVRFMLGALHDKTSRPELDRDALPLLERWVLHRSHEVGQSVSQAYRAYDFAAAMQALHEFCAHELSSIFFEVRKDALYCDTENSPRRQAALATLSVCLDACLSWMAPVLVFTAEDAWRRRHGERGVHREGFAELSTFQDRAAAAEMDALLAARDSVNAGLERARKSGVIQKASQARALLAYDASLSGDLELLAELCLVAELVMAKPQEEFSKTGQEDRVQVSRSEGTECPRCRLTVQPTDLEDNLCGRCHAAI